ncbi:non-hydrolyzing UDP-N-acetylglucosamine 2-epimerase [uncultured Methanoregula sp.]|uniref:non-hydrolyzing UDP-N-acetylglucosamine 2-epimerase n=1 Tax=uncultured Methanoregula sp. TaxID=1005933 RepID=UPI002AAB04BC|nr:UDP-N-acetylglucosamine 2-epimerase (non-hydrolyzing) [uncultured Methanoregula sp.]
MFAIILGTRPEIIKMSPIIRSCERESLDYFVLHTGQHYSYEMDRVFFEELGLPAPDFNLDVGSKSHAEQTGAIMTGVERVLLDKKPDVVLVQGDTNTVLAGTLAASKCYVRGKSPVDVAHVEAGLRSFDRTMPEEVNRIVADHLSRYLFAPTEQAREHLIHEGIPDDKIHVTGNTIVDAVFENLVLSKTRADTVKDLGLTPEGYLLVTLHRQENVDNKKRLIGILNGLTCIHEETGMPLVFPVHPRTEKMIASFQLNLKGFQMIKPVGFLEFLQLESNARLALTDSGGVQEETCILKVPCVTIRDSTERPETVTVGANIVAGFNPGSIIKAADEMMRKPRSWENPFGDGNAGNRIIQVLSQ